MAMQREWVDRDGEIVLVDEDMFAAELWSVLDRYLNTGEVDAILRAGNEAFRRNGRGYAVGRCDE